MGNTAINDLEELKNIAKRAILSLTEEEIQMVLAILAEEKESLP